jgi:hypothetical protein
MAGLYVSTRNRTRPPPTPPFTALQGGNDDPAQAQDQTLISENFVRKPQTAWLYFCRLLEWKVIEGSPWGPI